MTDLLQDVPTIDPLGPGAPPELVSIRCLTVRTKVPLRKFLQVCKKKHIRVWKIAGLYRVEKSAVAKLCRVFVDDPEEVRRKRRNAVRDSAEAVAGLPPRTSRSRHTRGSTAESDRP